MFAAQRLLMLVLFLCATMSAQMSAAVFHVSKSGSNANTGLSWTLPKLTIQNAITSSSSGDTILVEGGATANSVWDEQILINDKRLTIIGGQNNSATAANEATFPTVIRPTATTISTTYQLGTNSLAWPGWDTTVIRPIVYVVGSVDNPASNILNLIVDGASLGTTTDIYVGIAYRSSNGRIGSATQPVSVLNINRSETDTNNKGVGIMVISNSSPTIEGCYITNFATAGIALAGTNTSRLSATSANQPNPSVLSNLIVGTSRNSTRAWSAGILVTHGGRGIIRGNIITGVENNATNDGGSNRPRNGFGYGIYLADPGVVTLGDPSIKVRGNVVAYNEIALFVEYTNSSVNASLLQIGRNTFMRSNNTLSTGYTYDCSQTRQWTTEGLVRFRDNVRNTTQTLNLSNNVWGNTDPGMFEQNPTRPYPPLDYESNRVALWRETTGDEISVSGPHVPPTQEVFSVRSGFYPYQADQNGEFRRAVLDGANLVFQPTTLNNNYGYTDFNTIAEAASAAVPGGGTIIQLDDTLYVETQTVLITRSLTIRGANGCLVDGPDGMTTVRSANGVCGPVFWVKGSSNVSPNSDGFNRRPNNVQINDLYVLGKEDLDSMRYNWENWAFAFTGADNVGTNSPTRTKVKGVLLDEAFTIDEFFGMVTEIDPANTSARQSGPQDSLTDIDAKVTYVVTDGGCRDAVMTPDNVYDNADDPAIALILYRNQILVATCAELQAALDLAAVNNGVDNTPMSIVVTATITNCTANYNVNGGQEVVLSTAGDADLIFAQDFPLNLNSGSSNTSEFSANCTQWPGGTATACSLFIEEGANIVLPRVNIWPPACLESAQRLIDPGVGSIIYAADGNGVDGELDFEGDLYLNKQYDIIGMRNEMCSTGVARVNGTIYVQSGADVQVLEENSVVSSLGEVFGDGTPQVIVDVTSASLENFDPENSNTGEAIEMGLQFISVGSGNRRLSLPLPTYSAETPSITKRVYLDGLVGRGSSTGTITLNGAGGCSNPSVIDNVSVARIEFGPNGGCIQTALGSPARSQNRFGVGTNADDGSGGTIDLGFFDFSGEGMDIGKSVTFANNSNAELGPVRIRRAGNVLGGLDNATLQVELNQDPTDATVNNGNPHPQQAVSIVGEYGTIFIRGYGEKSSTPNVGSGSGSVWQFTNVSVTKPCEIRGYHYTTCAVPTECSNRLGLDGDGEPLLVPSRNPDRDTSLETVIGTSQAPGYLSRISDSDRSVFRIEANEVSIAGFRFTGIHTLSGTGLGIVDLGFNPRSDVDVRNNIVECMSGSGIVPLGLVYGGTTASRNGIDISCNYIEGAFEQPSPMRAPLALIADEDNISDDFSSSIFDNVVDLPAGPGHSAIDLFARKYWTISRNHIRVGPNSNAVRVRVPSSLTSPGLVIRNNQLSGGQYGIGVDFTGLTLAPVVSISGNVIHNNGTGVFFENIGEISLGDVEINSNYIAGNTNYGLNVVTTATIANATFIDATGNWWGDAFGPTRLPEVALSIQPFNGSGNGIAQSGFAEQKLQIVPFYAFGTDDDPEACGWTGTTILGPVLRMSSSMQLKGVYPRIIDARDNTDCIGDCDNRQPDDEIWVIGGSGGGSYPSDIDYEGAGLYPIQFSNSGDPNQPSTILGLNNPVISYSSTGGLGAFYIGPERDFFSISSVSIEGRSTTSALSTVISFYDYTDDVAPQFYVQDVNISNQATNGDFVGIRAATGGLISIRGGSISSNSLGYFIGIDAVGPDSAGVPDEPTFSQLRVQASTVNNGFQRPTISFGGNGWATGIRSNGFAGNLIEAAQINGIQATGQDFDDDPSRGAGVYVTNSAAAIIIGGCEAVEDIDTDDCESRVVISGLLSTSEPPVGTNGIVIDGLGTETILEIAGNIIGVNGQLNGLINGPFQGGYGILVYSSSGSGILGVSESGVDQLDPSDRFIADNLIGGIDGASAPRRYGIFVGNTVFAPPAMLISSNTIRSIQDEPIGAFGIAPSVAALGLFSENSVTENGGNPPPQWLLEVYGNVFGGWGYNVGNPLSRNEGNVVDVRIGYAGMSSCLPFLFDDEFPVIAFNQFRTPVQVVSFSDRSIEDFRCADVAGQDIRLLFGQAEISQNVNGWTFGAILTSDVLPDAANDFYDFRRNRPAIPLELDDEGEGEGGDGPGNPRNIPVPFVGVYRSISTIANNSAFNSTNNTIEVAPQLPVYTGSNFEPLLERYLPFLEGFTLPDQRVCILGAEDNNEWFDEGGPESFITSWDGAPFNRYGWHSSVANGEIFDAYGRSNRDLAGKLTFIAAGSDGTYGRIGWGFLDREAKGDVYIQGPRNMGNDGEMLNVQFRFYPSGSIGTLLVAPPPYVTGYDNVPDNATNREEHIKAGLDDADDDNFEVYISTSGRRTGVFRMFDSDEQFDDVIPFKPTPQLGSVSAFPNPASNSIEIGVELPFETAARIAIYDMLGREVSEFTPSATSKVITQRFDVSSLDSGFYIIRITDLFGQLVPITGQFTVVR